MDKFAVVSMIKRMADDAGSQSALARRLGVPRQHIHIALAGDLRPKVLNALGLARIDTYERINRQKSLPPLRGR